MEADTQSKLLQTERDANDQTNLDFSLALTLS